jgi:hypothetical protein
MLLQQQQQLRVSSFLALPYSLRRLMDFLRRTLGMFALVSHRTHHVMTQTMRAPLILTFSAVLNIPDFFHDIGSQSIFVLFFGWSRPFLVLVY